MALFDFNFHSNAITSTTMSTKKFYSTYRALLLATSLVIGTAAHAADWSSTDIQYRYGDDFNDNGGTGGQKIAKHLVQVQNSSGFSLGRTYFFLLMSKGDGADNNSGDLYSEGQATLSLSKLTSRSLSLGPLKDIGVTAGFNYGARNSSFRPNARVGLLGPTFDFNVPGFTYFNVDVLAYRDAGSYEGFGGGRLCGRPSTTYQITPVWLMPFNIGGARFVFDGYTDVIGAHGTCSQQVLVEAQAKLDVGNFWGVPDKFYVGLELQYWRNKFGTRGVKETVPQLVVQWKF